MKQEEYINLTVGKPYRKGADGPDEFDCWGIVVDSFRKIEGVEIQGIANRDDCDLDASATDQLENTINWLESPRNDADIFCCYQGGVMVHIGRILCNKALHSCDIHGGSPVAIWPWRKIELLYGDVKYFKFTGA